MFPFIFFRPDEGSGESEGGSEGSEGQENEGQEGSGSGGTEEGSSGEKPDLVPRSELAKANADAAKRRKELREAEKKIEELEGNQKTESEKLKSQHEKATKENAELSGQVRNLQVQVLAEDIGIVREARGDAARLLDWDSIEDPSDQDEVKAALTKLVEDRPYLRGNVGGGADGGAGGLRDGEQGDMNAQIRAAAGKG